MVDTSSQNPLPFAHIDRLLMDRSTADWETYWASCDFGAQDQVPFLDLVQGLIHHIQTNKSTRVILINEDRRLFLAGFLAALAADIPLVLPHSKASGVLEELCTPSDMILNDDLSVRDSSTSIPLTEIDITQAKIIFFTSGSTGKPKSINKTLLQLRTEIALLEDLWGVDCSSARFLSTVPHHHIYGLLFSLLWPVCAGYPIHLQTIHFWEDLMGIYTPGDVLISSPSHLGRLSPLLLDSPPLVFCRIFSSGAPLPFAAAQQSYHHLGVLPTEILGSTETGGIAYRQQEDNETPWTPFPGIRIAQNNDECLSLVSPYLPDNREFQTQDRIILHDDQSFVLLGRADRIVKIEGKRVSLDEIETNLMALEEITQAKVVPLLRTNNGSSHKDELGAVVILSPKGIDLLENRGKAQLGIHLRHSLKETCEPVAIPRKWRFVSEMPLTSHGKMNLQILQDLFGSEKSPQNKERISMKLGTILNPEVMCTNKSENSAQLTLHIPADLAYFEGHFTNAPLVPGVVQLHWAVLYGREHFDLNGNDALEVSQASHIKFSNPIFPNHEVCLSLDHQLEKKTIAFKYTSKGTEGIDITHSSGRFTYV